MTTRDLPLLGRWIAAARAHDAAHAARARSSPSPSRSCCSCCSSALNGNAEVDRALGGDRSSSPSSTRRRSAIFALTPACYTTLIFGLATARETGLLKRVRGTPLPISVYLAALIAAALITGIASVVLLFVVAVPAFGVDVYPRLLPAAIVTLVLGGVPGSLGLARALVAKTPTRRRRSRS